MRKRTLLGPYRRPMSRVALGRGGVSDERGSPVCTRHHAPRMSHSVARAYRLPGPAKPPWRQPRSKRVVCLVNSHANATSKRWHLWEIDLKFALDSTPGWGKLRHPGCLQPHCKKRPRNVHCHTTRSLERCVCTPHSSIKTLRRTEAHHAIYNVKSDVSDFVIQGIYPQKRTMAARFWP